MNTSIAFIKQKGFILITTLILMVLLTVLAIMGVSFNSIQTRMAANATDSEISFEKAQGALNEAINKIISNAYNANNFLQGSNGFYVFNQTAAPIWQTIDWTNSSAVIPSFQGSSGAAASYIIEQLPSVIQPGQNASSPTYVYRVTARAAGQNGDAVVLLQSTVELQQ